ncbi:MAG: hypothetical protein NTW30_00765, partial [Candidatus Aenigmarchaeota archaeon]|nr:hypothetical protein [Candidatus Aenigmarchaeota archaeon]
PLKSTTTTEGGGCPILKTWNGEKFIDVEKLNIHSKEGIDTTYSTKFDIKPINGEYKIILSEMWYALLEGSHIDHVKLIDKEGKECKLISAEHSKNGDVLSTIAKSDDIRVETRPGEDIELVFDGCSGNEFAFTIEGYNSQPAEMKEALSPTNIMAILITIALLIVIIFGIMKFSRNKSVEPKQKYDEEDSEQPFY